VLPASNRKDSAPNVERWLTVKHNMSINIALQFLDISVSSLAAFCMYEPSCYVDSWQCIQAACNKHSKNASILIGPILLFEECATRNINSVFFSHLCKLDSQRYDPKICLDLRPCEKLIMMVLQSSACE
jgi:hypothetical protein